MLNNYKIKNDTPTITRPWHTAQWPRIISKPVMHHKFGLMNILFMIEMVNKSIVISISWLSFSFFILLDWHMFKTKEWYFRQLKITYYYYYYLLYLCSCLYFMEIVILISWFSFYFLFYFYYICLKPKVHIL